MEGASLQTSQAVSVHEYRRDKCDSVITGEPARLSLYRKNRVRRVRSLRGRKDSYYESTTAVHFSALFRYVAPLCASKERKTVLAVVPSRYGIFYRADS